MNGNMTLDASRYKKVAVWRQKETKKSACALFPLEQKRDPVRQQRDDAARDDNAEEDDRHGAL